MNNKIQRKEKKRKEKKRKEDSGVIQTPLELERITAFRQRRRKRKTTTRKKTNKPPKTIKNANKSDRELGKAKTSQRRTRE